MRRGIVLILAALMLFSAAFAESTQKAPDYILEGYDGNVTYRIWDSNLFFTRMQETTGISFQFRQYTDFDEWTRRKQEIAQGINLPDVLFKAELNASEIRDLYAAGNTLRTCGSCLRSIRNGRKQSPWKMEPSPRCRQSIPSRTMTPCGSTRRGSKN